MSQSNFITFAGLICLLILQLCTIECRPRTHKIVIHGHEWTIPNEVGWEDFLLEAIPIHNKLLSNCGSSRDCLQAAEQIRRIYSKHSIASKYYDDSLGNDRVENDLPTIFRWG